MADVDPATGKETEEYKEQMTGKADAGTNTTGEEPLLAGKYKTEEDLQKGVLEALKYQHNGDLVAAYKALEKGIGKQQDTDPPADPPPSTEDPPSTDIPPKDEDKGAEASTLFDNAFAEYDEKGELGQETYDALAKAGLPKDVVDTYIAGQEAVRSTAQAKVFDHVGGQEAYTEMTSWAKENFTNEEIKEYNESVNSGNSTRVFQAIDALSARFARSEGRGPKSKVKGSGGGSNAQGFRSMQELMAAQKDPRYGKDPAYDADVMARLRASKL